MTASTQLPRALVLRAPGINCDRETAHACRLAGFATDLLHINALVGDPQRLLDYTLLVIPGGFSYGDDLGAGTLLAKNLVIHLSDQLHQFIDEGRLVLGICNGFQVLVRAGLLPGMLDKNTSKSAASLTINASAQFECRWVRLAPLPSACIFTQGLDTTIELPVAHGEGQFVLAQTDLLQQLQTNQQIPLVYTSLPTTSLASREAARLVRRDKGLGDAGKGPGACPWGGAAGQNGPQFQIASGREMVYTEYGTTISALFADIPYPANPNGSIANIAGVCNPQGNVFGLMPHPERFVHALQHPRRRGSEDKGDGLLLFQNAFHYAQSFLARQTSTSYAASGVNIAAADTAKSLMQQAVRATQGPEVLAGMGAFAGVYSLKNLSEIDHPALVASTDGVGTKTLLASQARRYDTIGFDLVNHSVNDLLTSGAKPLFFMDYLAMGKLEPEAAAAIVRSVAGACQNVGCALLGGETAEMPDVYLPGAFDLAGTIVGIVNTDHIPRPETMRPGDILLGLPSSGLHTNGYSLARRVFANYALDTVFPELGEPLIDALLRPHRCYLPEIQALREQPDIPLKGLAHITGGGFEGNISRILPSGIQAVIETSSWQVPPLFALIQRLGNVARDEMYRAFNMGIGMVLVLAPASADRARSLLPELLPIGHLQEGNGVLLT
jgi:phosphoribosylaminoimidazole synthetase